MFDDDTDVIIAEPAPDDIPQTVLTVSVRRDLDPSAPTDLDFKIGRMRFVALVMPSGLKMLAGWNLTPEYRAHTARLGRLTYAQVLDELDAVAFPTKKHPVTLPSPLPFYLYDARVQPHYFSRFVARTQAGKDRQQKRGQKVLAKLMTAPTVRRGRPKDYRANVRAQIVADYPLVFAAVGAVLAIPESANSDTQQRRALEAIITTGKQVTPGAARTLAAALLDAEKKHRKGITIKILAAKWLTTSETVRSYLRS